MGENNNIWGPLIWNLLHTISYVSPNYYDLQIKKNYFYFFNNIIPSILPCPICQRHYLKQLRNNPLHLNLNSKEELIKWIINIHNLVNIKNKKKIFNREEVDEIYQNKINIDKIYKLLFYLKNRLQYGKLDLNIYNKFNFYISLFVLNKIPNYHNGLMILNKY